MKYLNVNIYFFIILFVIACSQKEYTPTKSKIITNKHAKAFEISEVKDGYILKIKNKDTIIQSFLLTRDVGYESKNNEIIHIPVSKVVCFSTTHCAFISVLGLENSISGIGGTDYVCNEKIRSLILRNQIFEVGFDNQIDLEKIVSINPDVVFAYGINNAGMSGFQKLIDVGIPVIFVQDFKENTPLGRLEWLKFFACFYDKLEDSYYYFDSVENNYLELRKLVPKNVLKPKILVGLPWQGTWWVPGGDSYFTNFIKDAGGDYIFDDNNFSESQPKSIEEVFSKAVDIDIWLNVNSYMNKKSIILLDSRIADLQAFKEAKIYNNNKRLNYKGGNDFWESGVIHPDIILEDLINIFYGDSLNSKNLYYYKQIN